MARCSQGPLGDSLLLLRGVGGPPAHHTCPADFHATSAVALGKSASTQFDIYSPVLDANLTQQRGLGARLGSTVYNTCPGFFSWLHHHLWGAVRIDALPGPAQDRLLSSKFSTLEMQPPQGPLLGGLELLLRLDLAGTPPHPRS